MNTPLYNSVDELLQIAKSTSGHRIAEYNINNRSLAKNNKGVIGQIIEEGVFKYPVNSRAEADFANLGVELKVTGLKQLKNKKYVTKERLVLNIINYMEEYNISFENSSFWKKNKNLLMIFYLYDEKRDDFNFLLIDSMLNKFNQKDLEIIKQDWQIIQDKINSGKAHEISEADTLYLAACTKGVNASSMREQPNSNIKAKQRAFCLKASYMNTLINENLINEKCESIVSFDELKNNSFECAINNKLSKYFGKSEKEICNILNIENLNGKNKFNYLLSKMLGLEGKNINNTEEFRKSNIMLKTIRIEENGTIKEHMSFPTFKFEEVYNTDFEDSELYELLSDNKFLFVIFKKVNGEYHFQKIKIWNMPLSILNNEVRMTYDLTRNVIKSGKIIKSYKNGKYNTNFPNSKLNGICHVRPHDQKGIAKTNKGYPLPIQDKLTHLNKYTKQCFWLDKKFIKSIISD